MDSDLLTGATGAVAIGVGATAVMDLWLILQKRLFGIPSLDFRLVGRWIGHFRDGRLTHANIRDAEPVAGEAAVGWIAHYAIGVLFAGLLLAIWGLDWMRQPTLFPALVIGIGGIVAPFFILQPGLGMGIAASKTPKPWLSRFRSLVTHTSFAIGLYFAGLVVSFFVSA